MVSSAKSTDAWRKVVAGALIVLATCAGLYVLIVGSGFLIPIVVAMLTAELISSAVDYLKSYGMKGWLAKVCTTLIFVITTVAFVWMVYGQLLAISEAWPKYAARLNAIDIQMKDWLGAELAELFDSVVAAVDVGGHAAQFAKATATALGSFGLVLLYTAFLLVEHDQIPKKLRLLLANEKTATDFVGVQSAIKSRLRNYLKVKTLVSALTGGLCYLVLKIYGVDFAEFWGLLIFLLNFIPNIGSAVAVILPSIIALLQFDTIWVAFQVAALMICIQFVIGNVVEPRYMGSSLNLSPFVVIVALTFWGTVWGVTGMFLSVPITVTLGIICSHIPRLEWIAILLSSDGEVRGEGEGPAAIQANTPLSERHSVIRSSDAERSEVEELRREIEVI